ncbi:MAG: V-type ATP synthase subunit D [Aminobacterium colombiense]|uniref:H+transporting two-sector ATPase D subunit n=2 Tax=Aminobacteriaceae TaxID=3029087 RepID=D5EEX7_AMICL|nr:H+transporting two-sector ATPase D subunit [Aminobacterium colombiense DSM 12261]MDD4265805.1 V-type ATP synthase subunit D [Aminobacterium colombiense]
MRPPTREQLLDIRRQMGTVQYGKQLLEKKRDALLRAIEEDRRKFKELDKLFREQIKHLSFVYALVRMYEGQTVMQLLKPDAGTLKVISKRHTLMGCRFTQFQPGKGRGSPLTGLSYDPAMTSLYLDELLSEMKKIEERIWTYINLKAKLASLEKELSKTMMKINTLQYILLPELKQEESRIRDILSERERQERYAIKKLSKKKKGKGYSPIAK